MTTFTNRGLLRLADGTFDPGDLELALLTSVPTDAVARDWNVAADLVDEMSTGDVSNYARQAMGAVTATEDDAGDDVELHWADTSFGSLVAGATARAIATLDATSGEVFWVARLTGPKPTDGNPFTVEWAANGAAVVEHELTA